MAICMDSVAVLWKWHFVLSVYFRMYVDDGGGIKSKTVKDLRVQAFIDECLLLCPQNDFSFFSNTSSNKQ